MKRFPFLAAMLAASVLTAVATAAPAPKATGGYGYTVSSPVQRHFEFNAIQSKTDTCGRFWDVTGIRSFTFIDDLDPSRTTYRHVATLTQNGQTVGGTGGFPYTGPPYTYTWQITAGSVVGDTLKLTVQYDTGAPGTTMQMTGTIGSDGTIGSGTWTDNFGGTRTGTFTAEGATLVATYCGKGTAYYSDADGNWYFVNVKAVSVDSAKGDAWFAGPVICGNVGFIGSWLFVKVHDGGEPGRLVDQSWGTVTDQTSALAGVGLHGTPDVGPVPITSGNIQVH
jgi:hypothetical protein